MCYHRFNLLMVRSSGFGSTIYNYVALFRLAFASAPCLKHLTSLHTVTRRPILQKVRDQPSSSCCVSLSLLVSIRFQVLFHSPPGVLFTVPSRYYSLSVTRSYLALRDGPRVFTPGLCPVLLWIPLGNLQFRLRVYYPVSSGFPAIFTYRSFSRDEVLNPQGISALGLGSCSFARHYSHNRFFTFFSSTY